MNELIYGERFDALETRGGFAWGQAARDGCVGFVAAGALAPLGPAPTHRVAAIRADAFAAPTTEAAVTGRSASTRWSPSRPKKAHSVARPTAPGSRTADLAPIGRFEHDPVAVAERFLGAPYRRGGRTGAGVDGSGLIQQALYACGRACPRSADQQLALGCEIARAEAGRGDLVGWRGRVGLLLDEARIIHADAGRMAVVIEPLDAALARFEAAGRGAPVFRRF